MRSGKVTAILLVLTMVLVSLGAMGDVAPGFAPPPNYHNATIRVTLLHQNGTPAVGYQIQMTSSEGSWGGLMGMTNATGRTTLNAYYSFWGPNYIYAVELPNKRVDKTMLFVEPDGVYDITMRVMGPLVFDRTVHGIVTNRSSGEPVAGLGISAEGMGPCDNYVDVSNTTGLDGRFVIKLPFLHDRVGIGTFGLDFADVFALFYMSEDIYEYRHDIVVLPLYQSFRKVEVRLLNATTGLAMTDLSTMIEGSEVGLDHALAYTYPVLNGQGYFEAQAGPGEYVLRAEGDLSPHNVSFDFQTSVMVEGHNLKRDVHVEVPDLVPLEIRLWNGTAPLYNYEISYSHLIMMDDGVFSYRAYTWTDANGYGRFGVPKDAPITITSYISGYEPISYVFDPSLHTEPFKLNLTAVKTPVVSYQTGTVTVTLKDPVTGVAIPRFMAFLQGSSDVGGVFYLSQANDTGVLKSTVRAGHYEYIEAMSPLGSKSLMSFDVPIGGDLPMMLTLDRYSLPKPYVNCTFHVVDLSGDPVPNLFISYYNIYGSGSVWSSITTDMDGRVLLRVRPGTLGLSAYRSAFGGVNPYVFNEVRSEIGTSGMDIGTITACPAMPKSPYSGTVKDEMTGDALSMVYVSTLSYHTDEGTPHRSHLRDDPDATQLSYLESFSEPGGKFKGWGNDLVLLTFQKEGYQSKGVWASQFGRGPLGEVELKPMPEMNSFVSGTVVNGTDAPIWSELYVYDRARNTPEHVSYGYMEEKGKFNISLYPGEFTIVYYNDEETDWVDVTVPVGGLSGLKLVHRPNSELEGFVKDESGSKLIGKEVILNDPSTDPPSVIARTTTNEAGFYDFKTYQGDYKVSIERSEEYDGHMSSLLTSDGVNDLDHDILLLNRSQADITGKVIGSGGPYADGVPWATVRLLASDNSTLLEVSSDDSGSYKFVDVSHGTGLKLFGAPPANLTGEVGVGTGYLPALVGGLTVDGFQVARDIELGYYVSPPPVFVNITDFGPKGTEVALDADIFVGFSVPVKRSSVETAITMTPGLANLSFVWDANSTMVTIYHAPFLPNTTYSAAIANTTISLKGVRMWNMSGFGWSFTTVRETPQPPPIERWEIFTADAYVDQNDKDLTVELYGRANMTIFIVIEGKGSYKLTVVMLGDNGTYTVTIPGSTFDWNTTYTYHFSNMTAGPDLAPAFAGTFKTPVQPIIPDDDDVEDDDDDGFLGKLGVTGACLIIGIVLLTIIVLMVLVSVLVRRKGEEEEEMSWGEE